MKTALRLAAFGLVSAAPLVAQGNLSTQGYGYPQGQLSTRALSMGGAIGEIDATGPLNPASIGRLTNRTVLFQMEPEYRTIKSGTATDRTTTARYPLVSIGVPFGPRWVIGVSASSLLDRSWSTSTTRNETIGTDVISTTLDESSNGAMNDLRLAGAWTNHSWLYVGLGAHAVTGRNVISSTEQFADSSFNSFSNSRLLSYTGSAVSAGVQLTSVDMGTVVGLTYRRGNDLRVSTEGTTLASGNVPDHFGVSLAFTGIEGTVLAARVASDRWSSMTSMLVTAGEEAHDSWDIGGGAEITGPSVFGQRLLVRAGGRSRTLPFEAAGKEVTERSLSLGSGMNFGNGRMSADVTAIRQWRNAGIPSVKEQAWTLSISLTARP